VGRCGIRFVAVDVGLDMSVETAETLITSRHVPAAAAAAVPVSSVTSDHHSSSNSRQHPSSSSSSSEHAAVTEGLCFVKTSTDSHGRSQEMVRGPASVVF